MLDEMFLQRSSKPYIWNMKTHIGCFIPMTKAFIREKNKVARNEKRKKITYMGFRYPEYGKKRFIGTFHQAYTSYF